MPSKHNEIEMTGFLAVRPVAIETLEALRCQAEAAIEMLDRKVSDSLPIITDMSKINGARTTLDGMRRALEGLAEEGVAAELGSPEPLR